jgi:hypothetical protein
LEKIDFQLALAAIVSILGGIIALDSLFHIWALTFKEVLVIFIVQVIATIALFKIRK